MQRIDLVALTYPAQSSTGPPAVHHLEIRLKILVPYWRYNGFVEAKGPEKKLVVPSRQAPLANISTKNGPNISLQKIVPSF